MICLCWFWYDCSTDTSLGKRERHANVWSLTQRHPLASRNKEWKDRSVRVEGIITRGGKWKYKLNASSSPSSFVWQLSRLHRSLQSPLRSHESRSWWKVFGKSSHSHTSCHSPWTIPRFKKDSWDLKKMCCSSVHRYWRKEKHKWPCLVTPRSSYMT